MCFTVPFVGISRSLYESDAFSKTQLKLMGRQAAQDCLKGSPIGTWVARHSSFQKLLHNQYQFKTNFTEPIQAFFAISYCTLNKVKHWLIAQVSYDLYYVITERDQSYLSSSHNQAFKFKQLLTYLGLNSTWQQPRDYIYM